MAKFRIVEKYDEDLYCELRYYPQRRVFGFIWWTIGCYFGERTQEKAMEMIEEYKKSKIKKEIPKPRIVWEGEF